MSATKNHFDCDVGLDGLVERHGAARAQGVRANFVWVEPQSIKSNVGSPNPKVGHQGGAGDGLFRSPHALEINTNGRVEVSVFVAEPVVPYLCMLH